MTLEGEYYVEITTTAVAILCRNPHDIGRRILLSSFCAPKLKSGRNPHDIGRRILLTIYMARLASRIVAILMTLEGEYYNSNNVYAANIIRSQSS